MHHETKSYEFRCETSHLCTDGRTSYQSFKLRIWAQSVADATKSIQFYANYGLDAKHNKLISISAPSLSVLKAHFWSEHARRANPIGKFEAEWLHWGQEFRRHNWKFYGKISIAGPKNKLP